MFLAYHQNEERAPEGARKLFMSDGHWTLIFPSFWYGIFSSVFDCMKLSFVIGVFQLLGCEVCTMDDIPAGCHDAHLLQHQLAGRNQVLVAVIHEQCLQVVLDRTLVGLQPFIVAAPFFSRGTAA